MPHLFEKGGPLSYGRIFSEWKKDVVTTVSATAVTALSAKGGKVAKCLIVVRDCTHPTRQRQHVKGRIAESLGEVVTTDTQKHELTFSQDPYLRRHRMVTSNARYASRRLLTSALRHQPSSTNWPPVHGCRTVASRL
jgi:hypothetical protein